MSIRFPQDIWSNRFEAGQPVFETARGESAHATVPRPLFDGPWYARLGQALRAPGEATAMYAPEHYEPKYAYPLILWLHRDGGSERDLFRIMPAVSPRNYLGLSIRGSVRRPDRGWDWDQSDDGLSAVQTKIAETFARLGRQYNVHSERVFLAGYEEGAAMALRLLIARPQWFAGAVAFAATSLPPHAWPVCGEHSDGKRILLGCGERDHRIAPKDQLEAVRALHLAGFAVTPRTYAARHELTAAMLRDVDHWVMESIGAIA